MTINKKSLISTLHTAKKANVASAPLAEVGDSKGTTSVKLTHAKLGRSPKLGRGAKLGRAAKLARR